MDYVKVFLDYLWILNVFLIVGCFYLAKKTRDVRKEMIKINKLYLEKLKNFEIPKENNMEK